MMLKPSSSSFWLCLWATLLPVVDASYLKPITSKQARQLQPTSSSSLATTASTTQQEQPPATPNYDAIIVPEADRCGEIIDVHFHAAFWFLNQPQLMIEEMNAGHISQGLMLSVYGPIDDPQTNGLDPNVYTESVVDSSNGRILGIASLNTTIPNWDSPSGGPVELDRLATALAMPEMVGTKLAPPHTCMALNSNIMEQIVQTVAASDSPVVFVHIGTTPFCGPFGAAILGRPGCCDPEYVDPTYLEPLIQQYTNAAFVLVHVGADFLDPAEDPEHYYNGTNVDKSIALADSYDNVYLEISAFLRVDETSEEVYAGSTDILQSISDAGLAGKTIYGSDVNQSPNRMAPYLATAIERMMDVGFTDDERCMILGGNAMKVFGLEATNVTFTTDDDDDDDDDDDGDTNSTGTMPESSVGGGDDMEACVDALATNPACTFGGLCDCEEFVNSEESTGCDGVYSSPFSPDIEVRTVCAKYCGFCGGDEPMVEDEEEPTAPDQQEEGCVDALATNPACTFGGLCDCEEFVNSEESTGCDGVYSSPFSPDIEVRTVCARYCGFCGGDEPMVEDEEEPTAPEQQEEDCVDALATNPACTFGGLCDCEEFVNSEESTGCVGVYSSPFSPDIEVRTVCAKYCGFCGGDEPIVEDEKEPTSPEQQEEECIDALATNPACTFGGLCDCEEFVNSEESTGCDGVYSSPFSPDIEVRTVCAKYCGFCGDDDEAMVEDEDEDEEATAPEEADDECVDALATNPACTFGGLCDCEEFVNSEESTGCDGVYSSAFSPDIQVRTVCAKYCGFCGAEGAPSVVDKAGESTTPKDTTSAETHSENEEPQEAELGTSAASGFGKLGALALLSYLVVLL